YANLYEINLKKPLKLCQYPYSITPEIEAGDIRIRDKLFKACSKELKILTNDRAKLNYIRKRALCDFKSNYTWDIRAKKVLD
ncbi:MAG: hypothetical protein HUJ70_04675, partial [Pseudobutyrivibrio sp.]|nr:hypothetical protein [Pseudobutyrivibrio sp.]